ncbi:MAG: tetratricopeptide repeat protein [Acidobacteriota bacterium]
MSVASSAPNPETTFHGFCSPPALAELIRDLYLNERSGILVLSRGGIEKRILLDRGMVLGVSSSLEDERLPNFLAKTGILSPEEAEALKGLEDEQVLKTVLGRGKVNLETLKGSVKVLTQQVLASLFRWEDLEYRFEEGPVSAGPIETNVVVSFELIIRALRSMTGFERIREALVRQDRSLRFSDRLYLPFEQLSLSPVEGFLVSRIDGRSRVREILAQVPSSEEEAAGRFLFGLLILGLVNFVPPIGSGPLSCEDLLRGEEEKRRREERERAEILGFYALVRDGAPAAILGVEEGCSADRVKTAYTARKERFAPCRFLRKVQTELREELQIIEARLLEAFLALRSRDLDTARAGGATSERVVNLDLDALSMRKELAKSEKQSVEEERVRMSEQFFAKAREYWKVADYFNCIRYCEFATSYNDKNAAFFSLLGQALIRNPDYRWQKRAEGVLLRAAELEAFNPAHFVALGDFYRAHGLHAKARKNYEKALEILPTHAEAQAALRELAKNKG